MIVFLILRNALPTLMIQSKWPIMEKLYQSQTQQIKIYTKIQKAKEEYIFSCIS